MHLYQDQFSEEYDFPEREKPSKILIIASTPRCGSHMLGHALYKTNSFGFPLEYVHPYNFSEWKRRFDIDDFYEILTTLQRRRTSPNGVFAIKIHYSHIKEFGEFKDLQKMLPDAYYLLLRRNDILKQAVSLSIAQQTGIWIAGQKAVCDDPKYSFVHIHDCLRRIILATSSWQYTLTTSGCNYMEISFESICQNVSQSIKSIADFTNIEVDDAKLSHTQSTKKQGSNLNTEWRDKFLLDFSETELLDESNSKLKLSLISRGKNKLRNIFST